MLTNTLILKALISNAYPDLYDQPYDIYVNFQSFVVVLKYLFKHSGYSEYFEILLILFFILSPWLLRTIEGTFVLSSTRIKEWGQKLASLLNISSSSSYTCAETGPKISATYKRYRKS